MMKMFTSEQVKDVSSGRQHEAASDSSFNDRLLDSTANGQVFKGTRKGGPGNQMMSELDFSLTQIAGGKTATQGGKNVSFAAGTKAKARVAQMGQAHVEEGVDDIKAQLDQIRQRTLEVQGGVTEGFAVEDSKLLEAILEHILFHWDDIMACLVDELIEEEVLEMNRIEQIRSG